MRTRFAPSPTGYLHIGGVRTALYSWLYAKKNKGKFILRIEDTDRERSTQESVDAILEGMEWLGLNYDEGPFYQTKRMDRYKELIDQLLKEGKAYHCYCSKEELGKLREKQMFRKEKPRYNGKCRIKAKPIEGVEPIIRFKNPRDGIVVVNDLIKGKVVFENTELDDLVIARPDGTPTYNFTVVVDDFDMKVSHVVRGDDHLNNTPRQINILHALGAEPPIYCHVPMILGEDGKRLSKRHGAVGVMQFRDDGYLPEALLNYLVRLGWSHGDQEIFSIEEMIEYFNIKDVNGSPSTFNIDKLNWLNQQYIQKHSKEELAKKLQWYMEQEGIDTSGGPALADVALALIERAKTLVEMAQAARIFYQDYAELDAKAAKKALKISTREPMLAIRQRLQEISEWNPESINEAIDATAKALELNMGKIGQPLRVAVTGSGMSPPIDITLALIGKERSLAGLDKALNYIKEREANV